ncbi:MAG: lipopolysaccharide biosynthesis protein RfbH [Deltaproteobacteria bacterium]|nr:lipopolysaccharide biosynthesis protein RfbH [Deltaproteobacteria bacterium]
MPNFREKLRLLIAEHAEEYASKPLIPGIDYLPASGKCVGPDELSMVAEAAADMWLTAGRFATEFEEKFAQWWSLDKCLLVNSGSSANLLAFFSFTSPSLKDKAVLRNAEFITSACCFPSTITPALQYGLHPVFVDVDPMTLNPTVESIRQAIGPKTRAVLLAHTMGNPYRSDHIAQLCKDRGIWFLEDCCDALGAKIGDSPVGSFGDFATCSFYPAHHLTMGEGGAVLTNDRLLHRIALSLRDWGRDCWCPPGATNTCKRRFDWQLGNLPVGYDHKYVYSQVGFNLKTTDFQAAVGLAQLKKLEKFIQKRNANHRYLTRCLQDLGADQYFNLPQATPGTSPSWFGYVLTCREQGMRTPIVKYLERQKIGTRLLFGGNLTKQPMMADIRWSASGSLEHSNKVMNDSFWIGVWPGLGKSHLEYMASKIISAVSDVKPTAKNVVPAAA